MFLTCFIYLIFIRREIKAKSIIEHDWKILRNFMSHMAVSTTRLTDFFAKSFVCLLESMLGITFPINELSLWRKIIGIFGNFSSIKEEKKKKTNKQREIGVSRHARVFSVNARRLGQNRKRSSRKRQPSRFWKIVRGIVATGRTYDC